MKISAIISELIGSVKPDTTTFQTLRNDIIFNNTYFTDIFIVSKWVSKNMTPEIIERYSNLLDYETIHPKEMTLQYLCNNCIGNIGMETLIFLELKIDDRKVLTDENLKEIGTLMTEYIDKYFDTVEIYIENVT